jgi:hypothetical protein
MKYPQPRRGTWLVAAAIGTVLIAGGPARADFDLNGNWEAGAVALGFQALCNIDITQVTTSLSVTGTCDLIGAVTLSGTIDPMTGVFTLSGSAAGICTMAGSLTVSAQASDNSNFSGTLSCLGLPGTIIGSRCGNGQLDPGEQCDTGPTNGAIGNCCTAGCQYASNTTMCRNPFPCDPAEFCTGTSETCPADVKDPDGTACSTNNPCLTGETCSSGICANGTAVAAGTTCDVSIPCMDFQCDGMGTCQDVFNSDPCDDGDACTTNDACSTGFCTGAPLDCGLCQTCDSTLGCQPVIEQVCTTPTGPAAQLGIGEGASPADAQVKWKWKIAQQVNVQDFGDPRMTTSYALCIFDQDAQASSGLRLMLQANVPHSSTHWSPNAKGYKYSDSSLSADGMQTIVLKSSAAGTKITLRAKGNNLGLADLPATPLLTVQLKTSDGKCWGANYPTADKDSPTKLRATSGP